MMDYLIPQTKYLFVWLVADGWCWFVRREKYCWLIAGGWFVLREKYCWLVADKPNEQGTNTLLSTGTDIHVPLLHTSINYYFGGIVNT
jgi:hypothetical protein